MKIPTYPFVSSPNTSARPADTRTNTLVMHWTGGSTGPGAISWLTNPEAKASAHFVIDREGVVTQLVDTDRRAWHAGQSVWKGRPNVNDYSIGIEFVNLGEVLKSGGLKFVSGLGIKANAADVAQDPATGRWYHCYTNLQLEAGLDLTRRLRTLLPIEEIVGHSDISPGRKTDPGPLFPMARFRAALETRDNA